MKLNKVQKYVLIGFTMTITSVFIIILKNDAFAIEYTNYMNNKYGIEFDYPKIIYLDSINPSIKDNYMIIPVGAKFKDSNQAKLVNCANYVMSNFPPIDRGNKDIFDSSVFTCAYGFYNYNINIGKIWNTDPITRDNIATRALDCGFDDYCTNKINNIIKGKIALQP